ncbi:hypothetical protein [Parasedimentitalea maritima]|uniref:Uncharacterized protein n=1 Tax=Parasedimentitalea maritima TaxID=2578117 RepID=A0A6A4RCK7_9RHOB|nr:hypothetical protein [Zongyanglinia marina]KAE9627826.1 hypothetical protein GP644_17135 [Zongyanglinia marina]
MSNPVSPKISRPIQLPEYADRIELARIITEIYFPVSARTLRTWPLTVCRPSKRALHKTQEALDYAEHKLATAPRYRQNGA